MKLEKRNKEMSIVKKVLEGFFWFLPAIVVIYLVATGQMYFMNGIILITLFHF